MTLFIVFGGLSEPKLPGGGLFLTCLRILLCCLVGVCMYKRVWPVGVWPAESCLFSRRTELYTRCGSAHVLSYEYFVVILPYLSGTCLKSRYTSSRRVSVVAFRILVLTVFLFFGKHDDVQTET